MPTTVDNEVLALHGLAVKKAGPADAVSTITGLSEDEVRDALQRAVEQGHAMEAKGTFMVTPPGRAWLDEQYSEVFAELREDDAMQDAYDQFEVVNREVLDLFTRWQTIEVGGSSMPNDHTDEEYDNRIIDELGDLHDRVKPVLDQFAAGDPRFAVYQRRLEQAYDKVIAGEIDYVSGARVDSYHTVWFELHEDLIRTLDRTREEL